MSEERLKKLIGDAKDRLRGLRDVITGESHEVRLTATRSILNFAEREAQKLKLPLPPEHQDLNKVLVDSEKVQTIIEKGGKETGA